MLELKGKYNTAKVFTDNIDAETISQIINLCNQQSMEKSKIRVMRIATLEPAVRLGQL